MGAAQGRGGLAAAAAFLDRATALTPDPALQGMGARAGRGGGELPAGRDVRIDAAASGHGRSPAGSMASSARVATAPAGPRCRSSPPGVTAQARLRRCCYLQAARQLEPFDLQLARRAYFDCSGARLWQGLANHLGGAGRDARSSPVVPCELFHRSPPEPPHPLDLLVDGLALLTTAGRVAATPVLQRAAQAVAGMAAEDIVRWGVRGTAASSAIWDADASSAVLERQAEIVRDAGALAELPIHLSALAMDKAWNGDLATANGCLVAESRTSWPCSDREPGSETVRSAPGPDATGQGDRSGCDDRDHDQGSGGCRTG